MHCEVEIHFSRQVLKTAFAQTPKPTRHIRSLESYFHFSNIEDNMVQVQIIFPLREQLAKETGLSMRVIQVLALLDLGAGRGTYFFLWDSSDMILGYDLPTSHAFLTCVCHFWIR